MTEMEKLIKTLEILKVPFEVRTIFGTPQVCYPNTEHLVCDAICHFGSYGHEEGLLEIMGLVDEEKVGDTVEGWLTAAEVAKRIFNHYCEHINIEAIIDEFEKSLQDGEE